MAIGEDYGTIWVCICCMLMHANGECCADREHGGDSVEPWATMEDGFTVTMGLMADEHADDCPVKLTGAYGDTECECDRDTFSTSQCEGCGSHLHGERHAFRLWKKVAK